EETLRQILSLVDVVAAAAKVAVQRRPVDVAELRESCLGARIRLMASHVHHRPSSGRKSSVRGHDNACSYASRKRIGSLGRSARSAERAVRKKFAAGTGIPGMPVRSSTLRSAIVASATKATLRRKG